jgi:hypothetical protein
VTPGKTAVRKERAEQLQQVILNDAPALQRLRRLWGDPIHVWIDPEEGRRPTRPDDYYVIIQLGSGTRPEGFTQGFDSYDDWQDFLGSKDSIPPALRNVEDDEE